MKLAIIGASTGQMPLAKKAKELGLETICFAWEKGAVCKNIVDKFYPVSVTDKETILEICKKEKVDGIVSNASELLASVCAYLTENTALEGNREIDILKIQDKSYVRKTTKEIPGLSEIPYVIYTKGMTIPFEKCIVKPTNGSAKQGVFYADSESAFYKAVEYNQDHREILIEKFIDGREISVESISFRGQHHVLQITDKENSGAPHFVELSHHQPSDLPEEIKKRIYNVIPKILDALNFKSGASHIEMKIDGNDLYLIEVNPRGGGDEISNTLVELSTGIDYVKCMINASLGILTKADLAGNGKPKCSGIYFLCEQTKDRIEFFKNAVNQPWLIAYSMNEGKISEATGNYDRNGFLIYQAEKRILPFFDIACDCESIDCVKVAIAEILK